MEQFLEAALALPTLVYTALVAVSLGYWGLVIAGAVDLNPFDGAEGAIKGGVEGAVKGGVEGAVKGGAEAVKALAADGADVAGAAKAAGALTELLAFLGLRQVPITISLSLFSLFGWTLSYFTRFFLDPMLPAVASALAATAASVAGGLVLTGAVTRPLSRLFIDKVTAGGQALVGRTAIVTIDVDERGGQAEIHADNVILSARCAPGLRIARGVEVVILEMDEQGVALLEPLQALVPSEQDAFAQAAAQHAASTSPMPAEAAQAVLPKKS